MGMCIKMCIRIFMPKSLNEYEIMSTKPKVLAYVVFVGVCVLAHLSV